MNVNVIELPVSGMSCGGCTAAVERALSRVDGVTAVQVELDPGSATVSTDGTLDRSELVTVIERAGYRVPPDAEQAS